MLRIDTRYHGFDQPGSATKIGGIALPNFNSFYFNTKTAPAMSDENYKKTIVEQAKKDAASGKFQTESKDYTALMKSYVSVASPDRKAVITSGLNRLFNKGGLPTKKEIKYPNIIEILFGGKSFSLESVASGGQLTYAEFKDANGNAIAYYNNGGWNECSTDAENARIREFLQIYNDAWRAEYKGESGTRNSEGAFDITV